MTCEPVCTKMKQMRKKKHIRYRGCNKQLAEDKFNVDDLGVAEEKYGFGWRQQARVVCLTCAPTMQDRGVAEE